MGVQGGSEFQGVSGVRGVQRVRVFFKEPSERLCLSLRIGWGRKYAVKGFGSTLDFLFDAGITECRVFIMRADSQTKTRVWRQRPGEYNRNVTDGAIKAMRWKSLLPNRTDGTQTDHFVLLVHSL